MIRSPVALTRWRSYSLLRGGTWYWCAVAHVVIWDQISSNWTSDSICNKLERSTSGDGFVLSGVLVVQSPGWGFVHFGRFSQVQSGTESGICPTIIFKGLRVKGRQVESTCRRNKQAESGVSSGFQVVWRALQYSSKWCCCTVPICICIFILIKNFKMTKLFLYYYHFFFPFFPPLMPRFQIFKTIFHDSANVFYDYFNNATIIKKNCCEIPRNYSVKCCKNTVMYEKKANCFVIISKFTKENAVLIRRNSDT